MPPAPYRVIVRSEAEVDITDAAVWYHNRQSGLGDEFLSAVESAIARAAENPFRFPCLRRKPEVRRVLTDRFSLSRLLHSPRRCRHRISRPARRAS